MPGCKRTGKGEFVTVWSREDVKIPKNGKKYKKRRMRRKQSRQRTELRYQKHKQKDHTNNKHNKHSEKHQPPITKIERKEGIDIC